MKRCPNCGRAALRTMDWACQWCAYPLISTSYNKIPKTFSELQAERQLAFFLLHEPEPEAEFEQVPAPELAPEPEPEPEAEAEQVPEPEPAPEPEPEPEAEAEQVPEPEPTPEPEPEAEAEQVPEPEPAPEPEPEAEVGQVPVPVPVPAPETALIELSVEELYASLGGGITATDARYGNRSLTVTGLVYRKIINENLDVAYVIMTSTKNYGEWQVTCTFDKEYESEIRRLMERDAVTVQGKYDGYGATFLLRDCTLVR